MNAGTYLGLLTDGCSEIVHGVCNGDKAVFSVRYTALCCYKSEHDMLEFAKRAGIKSPTATMDELAIPFTTCSIFL